MVRGNGNCGRVETVSNTASWTLCNVIIDQLPQIASRLVTGPQAVKLQEMPFTLSAGCSRHSDLILPFESYVRLSKTEL